MKLNILVLETIKQLRADVQIKEENSHQIKRQYEAGIGKYLGLCYIT